MGCGASVPATRLESPSVEQHVALVRANFPFQAYIERTEHRGITIGQLQRVFDFAVRHAKTWHDTAPEACSKTSGRTLCTKIMNLYHLNTWLILPATEERDCAMVELLATAPQAPRWFISHWWGEALKDFLLCARRHTELRGSTEADPFWVCAHANRQHSLAAEVVANPRETSFYKALQLARGVLLVLDARSPLGGPATPFTRIWCAFEEHVALTDDGRDSPLLLDIATCHRGAAQVLTDGLAEADDDSFFGSMVARESKARREAAFPEEVLARGLSVSLETAQASVDSDRVHILNAIAEMPDLDGPPPADHPNYQLVNRRLRCTFALAAWPNALRRGKVQAMGLPRILKADTGLAELNFTFCGIRGVDDDSLGQLVSNVPPQLQRVALDLSMCDRLTEASVKNLGLVMGDLQNLVSLSANVHKVHSIGNSGWKDFAAGVSRAPCLQTLKLDGISTIDNPGLRGLARGLSKAKCMQDLTLNFGAVSCRDDRAIGDRGVCDLAEALAAMKQLKKISLTLSGFKSIGVAGIQGLAQGFRQLPSLRHIWLNLMLCESVGDPCVIALASCIADLAQLDRVDLLLRWCPVGDAGAVALVNGLSGSKSLSRASVDMLDTALGDLGKKKLLLGCPNLGGGFNATYDSPSGKDFLS